MMSSMNERWQILEMIDGGVISAEEGARLLKALEGHPDQDEEIDEPSSYNHISGTSIPGIKDSAYPTDEDVTVGHSPKMAEFDAHIEKWRRWWMIPLWVGVGITILGALLMFWAFQVSGLSFWFGCTWFPFLIGIGVMVLAWSTRTSRWLHLRVQQKPGERPQSIAFSFPIPLRLTAWILRLFRNKIPKLGNSGFDELVLALGDSTDSENPFYLEVDEGEKGERVQIYIG
jgi:hypothetical protein